MGKPGGDPRHSDWGFTFAVLAGVYHFKPAEIAEMDMQQVDVYISRTHDVLKLIRPVL